MVTNDITKKSRNLILGLLFLGWSLGNLDRYIMNYAVVSITDDLSLDASSKPANSCQHFSIKILEISCYTKFVHAK
ncbi:hypothetical protein ACMGD3_06205 [Lysinibacillus sphaericus]|uniref:hypothetical protein n=1 Tax=Lysinibacillus sphaericus TaxID=1421 RepID=UPI003F7A73F6